MAEETPGERLETAIRSAMARQGTAQTIMGLSRDARINRGTLYEWFNDVRVPSSAALGRVAKIIEVPIRDLWDAFEGREQTPTSTEEAVVRLIARLDRQSSETQALMRLVRRALVSGYGRAADVELGALPETPLPPKRRREPDHP